MSNTWVIYLRVGDNVPKGALIPHDVLGLKTGVYLSSTTIDPVIVDYYLHLLPGITGYHAKQRLTLLSCYDSSSRSLTEKILERPRLIERIKQSIPPGHAAHMACFNVTAL